MEFVRQPRVPPPPLPDGAVLVEAPPLLPAPTPQNPLARLLPLAMLVAAVGMMVVYFTSGGQSMRNPMYMFFPVMMLTSVLGSLVYGAKGTGTTAEINRGRQKYLDYLDHLDREAEGAAEAQRESLRWHHPEPGALWTLTGSGRMWERTPDGPDYGVIRVGIGEEPLSTALTEPELDGTDEQDPVTVNAVRRLIRCRSVVTDVPITLALRRFSAITLDGDAEAARAFLRAAICQLAVFHGPDDVAIVADPRDQWDWLKWLPHQRHSRTGAPRCDIVRVLDRAEGLELRIESSRAAVAVGERLQLRVTEEALVVHGRDDEEVYARPDLLTVAQATACARRLARYRLTTAAANDGRKRGIDWMDLMGIGEIDPEKLWRATGDGGIVPVPMGFADNGTRVLLDINEAARGGMGPHGLCVGATGSGKSELLRTLALGMIASHPPDALNLILVDFKGGATFVGMERARHVGAVITNLAGEAHLVSRMNDALLGEMNRRQEVLRAAGRFASLAEYQRARSLGAHLPPMPALFILVDEFSELLSQHPDFAELFVAIGRLGRSLGMHLLLASQRLDEGRLRGLETHLSYRICLKTFSAGESRAVLGVPDAYHLPSTPGSAYLKSTSGDLVRFQTAFVSGAGRESCTERTSTASPPARLFTAATVDTPSEKTDIEPRPPTRTVLDTVLDRVAGRGAAAHQVWLPPLTQSPTLDALLPGPGPHRLTVPIGLVDKPYEQRRDPFVVELDGAAGNVAIVGAPRSGKSTALRTMVLALAEHHDPADVGFYCLDFGGGALSSLRDLPHVGSMAGRLDGDLCRRTVAVVTSVMRTRESLFRRLAVDSMAAYRRHKADRFGDVFLVIDGWATLRQEFDHLEGTITAIAAQGLSFGVHVVITASRWAELRPALKDQIATRIELRLGDPAESEMDRKRARDLSGRPPGRGITPSGREFAVALPRWDGVPTVNGLAEAITADTRRLRDRWAPSTAPVVRLLPTQVPREELEDGGVVLGVGERELSAVELDFAEQPHLLVLGDVACGKTATLRLLCLELIRGSTADEVQLEIIDFRRALLGVVESEHLSGYAMSPASLTSRLPAIIDRLEARMPGDNVTQQQLRTRSWWTGPDIYLVIDDYDLVAGATGNPLAPLAEFLPHALDLGLHVVVARRSGGAARAMFDPVLARMRELGCMGLMMSASAEEGVLLGTVKPSALPPGRGTLITRGDANQLVQVAWTDPP
ncbi:type VII secretion protein EccCa [Mycolicibacterium gadium]|uniref:Type VII secretion protein EccCa n=1 Tax=Mycolicibacterium gadium TaxID=1794 RepID=A0ABT6GJJ9_MYCGU|nr:type VII secretion protein EccCa [Mycolicibacterium gadium]MDG5481547.1 type VII secretion protein EccCa [Mycolicibacterium gadium]